MSQKHKKRLPFILLCVFAIVGTAFLFIKLSNNPQQAYQRGSAEAAKAWQKSLRTNLKDQLKVADLFDLYQSTPVTAAKISEQSVNGIKVRAVRLQIDPRLQSSAFLSIPNDLSTPRPAVICMHGHGSNPSQNFNPDSEFSGLAYELTKRGYVTLSLPLLGCQSQPGRTRAGERLWKLSRGVSYLESLDFVDSEKIGGAGLSMGGEMAMWLGAMDTRVKATVCAGFLTTMDHLIAHQDLHCPCWKVPGLESLVDFSDIFSLHGPRPLLCQIGRQEKSTEFPVKPAQAAMENIQKIYQDLGAAGKESLKIHAGGHELHLESALAFFETHLPSGAP